MNILALAIIGGLSSLLLIAPSIAWSYETSTHEKITNQSVLRSRLAESLAALGLQWEQRIENDVLFGAGARSARDWISLGSGLEDTDSLSRPVHHFYNPLNGRGLSVGGFEIGLPSLVWGLEDVSVDRQDFSLRDANDYLWVAVRESDPVRRERHFSVFFRTLGHVVHLVQDLAQPQHTRNDEHPGIRLPGSLIRPGWGGAFETFAFVQDERLSFGDYPVVELDQPRDYWTRSDGVGLADFSNRSFVSQGTNFRGVAGDLLGAEGFPSPGALDTFTVREDIQDLLPGSTLEGHIDFIATRIHDAYTGESFVNPRASSYGFFDADLERRGFSAAFSLNRFNHQAALDILIPRAVGYGAGFLDRYFRDGLEITPPVSFAYAVAAYENGAGRFDRIRARVRDTTPDAGARAGTLVAALRYRTSEANLFEQPNGEISDLETIAVVELPAFTLSSEAVEVTFDFSNQPIPVSVADVHLTVAFRGGVDDGVLVGGVDLREPDRVRFTNATDYLCLDGTLYDVVGLTPQERDVDGDGRMDLDGPYAAHEYWMQIRSADPTAPAPSPADHHHLTVLDVDAARYASLVVLQGDPTYRVMHYVPDATDLATGSRTHLSGFVDQVGTVNRLRHEADGPIREINVSASTFRGVLGVAAHHAISISPRWQDTFFGFCNVALANAPRPVTEKEGEIHAFADDDA